MSEEQLRANAQSARQQVVAEIVMHRGEITIDELAEATGVSAMTIYRDVAALEEAGLVQRHRGRITALASGLHEASAAFRVEQQRAAKEAMAAAVAPRIRAGSSLLLDDSTSGSYLLKALVNTHQLTIITNSLLIARQAASHPHWRLFVTGGEYQPWADALMGPTAIATVAGLDADYCVLSASGIAEGRCHHPYQDVAAVKRQMLSSARSKILLLDHTKLTRNALHEFARIDEFDQVVVDAQLSEGQLAELRSWGANVHVAANP